MFSENWTILGDTLFFVLNYFEAWFNCVPDLFSELVFEFFNLEISVEVDHIISPVKSA